MPVEIRELIIRATIVPEASGDEDGDNVSGEEAGIANRAEIVRECVREVIKIIENNRNR